MPRVGGTVIMLGPTKRLSKKNQQTGSKGTGSGGPRRFAAKKKTGRTTFKKAAKKSKR